MEMVMILIGAGTLAKTLMDLIAAIDTPQRTKRESQHCANSTGSHVVR